jgi:phage baseplate assembly protein W
LTNFSDRPFRPDLGGNVTSYLFENATEFTGLAIRDEILRVIRKNEPRVINPKVIVELDEDRNQLLVTIAFTIKLSHEQTEISFFLDRIR